MPSLPHATRAKLSSLGLSTRDVDVLMSVDSGSQVPYDGEMSRDGALVYFNKVAAGRDPKIVANWSVTTGLLPLEYSCSSH
jgi:aspartyl-tRNA(Asn)/glutamyl-tRNA(Gln) amidotransferase subunit B